MKIVHLSTSDKGGAGIAAMRLHIELMNKGYDSNILTDYRFGPEVKNHFVFRETMPVSLSGRIMKSVKYRLHAGKNLESRISEKHLKNRPAGFEYFSFPFSEDRIENHPLVKKADIIHLHWISQGFLNYKTFFKKINTRIVWTLHDMNPFTGGCHYAEDCEKFNSECKNCPQLKGTIDENYSFKMQSLKKKSLQRFGNGDISIVAPSSWLRNESVGSVMFNRFNHYTIPNGIDPSVYYPHDKKDARIKLKLPAEKKILLFVSNEIDNIRKGIHYLREALALIQSDDLVICTIGKKSFQMNESLQQFNLGFVTDEKLLAEAYSAADYFILPSLAENFPNTICESLFCGTPVIAFNSGGIGEQVNERNGFLVNIKSNFTLAEAIKSALSSVDKFDSAKISSEVNEKFNISKTTLKYIEVYNSY